MTPIAPHIATFLRERLPRQRGASEHTCEAYAYAFKLLFEYASARFKVLLGVLDDRSRLACHVQWYLEETAECLVHGLGQTFQKRALPRALMSDNGSAMVAEEVREGLHTLKSPA